MTGDAQGLLRGSRPAPTELRRVLNGMSRLRAALLDRDTINGVKNDRIVDQLAEAERVLREMARDFAHFAPYVECGVRALCPDPSKERARLDAARAKWRLDR